jgi:lipopolysaccharide/colanic/teichoic acid biosynthesis glycosyltransferase
MLSVLGLPVFGLIYIVVAPMIILDDGLPVFYNALRIGKNGKLFKMYKFRTMKKNAPDIRLADGSTYNGVDDPRVTRVGRFLRSTSIDEIPQILNMLKGEMSLIGPRPDPPDWLERYPSEVRIFLQVRPGLTGYSQAFFRNSVDGNEKMKNDAYYAKHCTFLMDLKIFLKSIVVVLGHENTYKDMSQNQMDETEKEKLKILEKI